METVESSGTFPSEHPTFTNKMHVNIKRLEYFAEMHMLEILGNWLPSDFYHSRRNDAVFFRFMHLLFETYGDTEVSASLCEHSGDILETDVALR